MRFLLVAVLIGVCPRASAQHVVDLADQGAIAMPEGIHVDSVCTTFDGEAPIGLVMKGMMNRSVPAYLLPTTAEAVRRILPVRPDRPGDLHCLLRIQVLRISERAMGTVELAPCALNIEVLLRSDTGWAPVFEYANTTSVRSGIDATRKHPANIRRNLEEGLARFAQAWRRGGIRPAPTSGYHLLTAATPRAGLYRTFMDLRDQRADTTTVLSIKPARSGAGSPLAMLELTPDTVQERPWGFCDGNTVYMDIGRRYMRLDRQGDRFTARLAVFDPMDPSYGAAIAAGAMFGLIGGAIAGAAVGAGAGTKAVPVELDLLTGSLVPSAEVGRRPMSDQVFVYSRYCAMDTAVAVELPDGRTVTLTRNTYHQARLEPRAQPRPVRVRVGSRPPVALDLAVNEVDGTQVYLIKVNSDGVATIDHLNDDMAQGVLDKLKPEREVR